MNFPPYLGSVVYLESPSLISVDTSLSSMIQLQGVLGNRFFPCSIKIWFPFASQVGKWAHPIVLFF